VALFELNTRRAAFFVGSIARKVTASSMGVVCNGVEATTFFPAAPALPVSWTAAAKQKDRKVNHH
jgi:hypothetical protein